MKDRLIALSRRGFASSLMSAIVLRNTSIAFAQDSTLREGNSTGTQGAQQYYSPAYLVFEMKIDWKTVANLQIIITELMGKGIKDFYILMSSFGGDVPAAIAAYNFLRGLDIRLSTYNLGDVQSSANIIFLAGQNRFCAPTARFMFHPVQSSFEGNNLFSTNDYKENIAGLQSDINRMKTIYKTGTKIDDDKADELLSKANWIEPKTALNLGIVSSIQKLQIPFLSTLATVPIPN